MQLNSTGCLLTLRCFSRLWQHTQLMQWPVPQHNLRSCLFGCMGADTQPAVVVVPDIYMVDTGLFY
jgi:hypothetical protein